VVGIDDVLHKMKEVFASLYNDRAISYRVHKGFAHADVALSAGVQRMVRSDLGAAGVMFTIDTESGFDQVVFITSSYGLGETVVQGAVNPDEFYVHKPMLRAGKRAVIRRNLGSKLIQMVFATPRRRPQRQAGEDRRRAAEQRNRYSLTDADVEQLARYALIIEEHYGRPMDIEWGKDGTDGQLYILQARPETVKSQQQGKAEQRYKLKGKRHRAGRRPRDRPEDRHRPGAPGAQHGRDGQGAGRRRARHRHDRPELGAGDEARQRHRHQPRRPHLPRGHHRARAGHPGRGRLRRRHRTAEGRHAGHGELRRGRHRLHLRRPAGDRSHRGAARRDAAEIKTKITMNVGNPQLAFDFAQLPNDGVGLARLEFIINNNIGVHPKAILDYPNVDADLKKAVESVARGHASPRAFYVDKVAEGVATIAAAFWPKPVIVRLSDFKSNEYRKLIGGSRYEPEEENPMLGFRGARATSAASSRKPSRWSARRWCACATTWA
jgi:pyruvate,water dikinase